ncbi:hypothetical protein SAMN04488020_10963 [Palleronia marisminoris]|uniref:hypothetical protein n=1 Tax=Palleronia marisminoris TaxID=315423 RepID=UPI0008EAA4B8|nr:hypothetical protein [Palleronia marisminoris]SFH27553.1 hypothetical protein SAMN04488020_10963 [Palleronia marisminoris]
MTELFIVLALVLGAVTLGRKVVRWLSAMFRRRRVRKPVAPKPFSEVEIRRANPVTPPPEPELSIEYVDRGIVTQRDIAILSSNIHNPNHIRAWCFTRGEERTFRNKRIRRAIDLRTGQEIKDLGRHLARRLSRHR